MEFIRDTYLLVIILSGKFFLFVVRMLFFVGFLGALFMIVFAVYMLAFGGYSPQEFGSVIAGSIIIGVSLTILNKIFLDEV
jgi:hypothetical protein